MLLSAFSKTFKMIIGFVWYIKVVDNFDRFFYHGFILAFIDINLGCHDVLLFFNILLMQFARAFLF